MIEHDKTNWSIDRQIKNLKNRRRRNKGVTHIAVPLDQARLIQSKRWIGGVKNWETERKFMKLDYPIKLTSAAWFYRGAEELGV